MSPKDSAVIESAFKAREAGKLDESESLLRQLLGLKPHLTEAKMGLGIILNEAGRPIEALEFFKQVLRDDPSNFAATNWLAVLLTDVGRSEEALALATRALQMMPRELGPIVSMGRTLHALGRYGESVAYFDKALTINPKDASYHQFRGYSLEKMYRDDEAVASFREAVRLSPTPERLVALAECEISLGNFDEAMDIGKQALAQDPELILALTIVARSLTNRGEEEAASSYWQAALSLAEDPTAIRLTRVNAWLRVGMFEAATDELRCIIASNPESLDAYFSLFMASRFTESERPMLDAVNRVIASDEHPDEGRMLAYYAAAKAHDNLGEYERAISAYNVANRLKRHIVFNDTPFDRADFEAQISVRSRIFTPQIFGQTCKLGSPSDIPVLVVGMMRSGTTLLEQILTCHPDIGGVGEQSYWMTEQLRIVDLKAERVAFDRLRSASDEYVALLKRMAPNCKRVVDKNPANVFLAGMIHSAMPNARFILTKRNPVDTALSIWMTPARTTAPFFADRKAIVAAYQQYLRVVENLKEVLPPERFLEVEYEELVTNPETEIRRMLEFLEVEWNEACLHPEQNDQSVRTPSFWQVRQPFNSESIAKWKKYEPWLGVFKDLMPG